MAIANIVKLGVAGMFLTITAGCSWFKTSNESHLVRDPYSTSTVEVTDGPTSRNVKTVVDSQYPMMGMGMVGGSFGAGAYYPGMYSLTPEGEAANLNYPGGAIPVGVPGSSGDASTAATSPETNIGLEKKVDIVIDQTEKNREEICAMKKGKNCKKGGK